MPGKADGAEAEEEESYQETDYSADNNGVTDDAGIEKMVRIPTDPMTSNHGVDEVHERTDEPEESVVPG